MIFTITRYCVSGIYAEKQGHGTKKILYELTDSSNIGAPNLLYCPFVLFCKNVYYGITYCICISYPEGKKITWLYK